jgi:GxxExxY protein
MGKMIFMTENEIGTIILEAAIEVHRALGPGLLESVYEAVMASELTGRGLVVRRQVPVPIQYKGLSFEEGFRADIVVNGLVIIELKSIENISKAHRKQIQTYLRLTGMKLGYILNFGCELMKDGIVRAVNGLEESPLRASAPLRKNDGSSKRVSRGGAEARRK